MNGGGDILARGARSAVFPPAGAKVSQEKWDAIFDDYDPKNELAHEKIETKDVRKDS